MHFGCSTAKPEILKPVIDGQVEPTNSSHLLLEAIQREGDFSTLLLWRRKPIDCFADFSDWRSANFTAKLIFDANYTIYLNAYYNRALLSVVCLDDFVDLNLLESMSESLQHMREVRILFLLKNFTTAQSDELEELFAYCDQQQMLNVVAVFRDFQATGRLNSFTRFPNFTLESYPSSGIFYRSRFNDLQGYELRSMPSQSEPGSIVYTDGLGEKRSSGYVYHLISTFAAKLNATLTYRAPLNVGASIEISILADLTSNYELDLPIGLQMPVENDSLYAFSNIVEISSWMLMLPRSGYIERYQVYKYIFQSNTLKIDVTIFIIFSLLYTYIINGHESHVGSVKEFAYNDVIFNDKIFRGVVGLPFQLRRKRNYKFYLLYFLIFLQGLIWSTAYSAQLHAFSSQPPSGEQIKSYADLKARGIKIVLPLEEYEVLEKFMPESFMLSYRDLLLVFPELRDFYTLRKSLNPGFAYSTHSEMWAMVERQQRYFSQRLFRVSEEAQFHRQILLAVPLAENSVYRATFNAYLLEMQAYGFWHHWTTMSLFEMIKAGKLSLEDLTIARHYEPLHFQDLHYIWLMYIFGIAIGSLCFITEILKEKFKQNKCPRDGQGF
ncbi:PREDICTED: uncharacterized protein LOC108973199 [Bactrocera latifrons]|uniref:uncharacterized protein LOC108973199 n=1 Tax=Bactrocera latifrons TaxID=174628 RepID=UPI0008DE878A|nr:PREDICTED: uncharacterized protein LOC108973199 [Bactrocera latifrons]